METSSKTRRNYDTGVPKMNQNDNSIIDPSKNVKHILITDSSRGGKALQNEEPIDTLAAIAEEYDDDDDEEEEIDSDQSSDSSPNPNHDNNHNNNNNNNNMMMIMRNEKRNNNNNNNNNNSDSMNDNNKDTVVPSSSSIDEYNNNQLNDKEEEFEEYEEEDANNNSEIMLSVMFDSIESSIDNTVQRMHGKHGYTSFVVTIVATITMNITESTNENPKMKRINDRWTVERRYNEFVALDKAIKRLFHRSRYHNNMFLLSIRNELPALPGKSYIAKHTADFINNRRIQLEIYLKNLISVIQRNDPRRMKYKNQLSAKNAVAKLYRLILLFLDIESSPFSYLFSHCFINDPKYTPSDPIYTEKRIEKNHLKRLIHLEQLKLKMMDEAQEYKSIRSSLSLLLESEGTMDDYNTMFQRCESLQSQLNQSRCFGDEFLIQMTKSIRKRYNRQQTLELYVFNVSKYGRIQVYANCGEVNAPELISFHRRNLIQFNIEHIKSTTKVLNSFQENGCSMVQIEFSRFQQEQFQKLFGNNNSGMIKVNNGTITMELLSLEANELISVLGAHVRQLNINYHRLIQYLKHSVLTNRNIKYDSDNTEHEKLLYDLWDLANLRNEKLKDRRTPQWSTIGFQGNDPATDFRAMGLLGLQLLIYLFTNYNSRCKHILSQNRDYPFCVAGINVANALLDMLNLKVMDHRDKSSITLLSKYGAWDNIVFNFMCRQWIHARNHSFEETFCLLVELLDHVWVDMNATYMRFNEVLNETKRRFLTVLQFELPQHFDEMRNLLGLASGMYPLH
jgi:hypothetical protein